MTIDQQKMREVVLQLLFCHELSDTIDAKTIDLICKLSKISRTNAQIAKEVAEKVYKKKSFLDTCIEASIQDYDLNRIGLVELNILRIGAYEMLDEPKLPYKIAIAEAIRLAKKFATGSAVAFVNAVLDQLKQKYIVSQSD